MESDSFTNGFYRLETLEVQLASIDQGSEVSFLFNSRVIEFFHPVKTRSLAVLSEGFRPVVTRSLAVSQQAANVVSVFLTPTAVLAFVFAAWRLGDDLGWTGEFPVNSGFFSHWLVWIALGVGIQTSGRLLPRTETHEWSTSPETKR